VQRGCFECQYKWERVYSRLHTVLFLLILQGMTASGAQSARNLGMGGVIVPDETAGLYNPAYSASEFENRTVLPLPLGGINLIPQLNFSNGIEGLAIFEQGTHLSSYLLNPPQSPELIEVDIFFGENMGALLGAVEVEGGSPLRLTSKAFQTHSTLNLPVDFRFGSTTFGLRPFGYLSTFLATDDGFRNIFAGGSTAAALEFTGEATAGLSFDATMAEDFFPDNLALGLFLGARLSPYLGVAHAAASGEASAEVAVEGRDLINAEAAYSYELTYFISNGFGYGFTSDLGLALRIGESEEDHLDLGIGVNGLGAGKWPGVETTYSGTGVLSEEIIQKEPTKRVTSRVTVSPTASMTANVGYTFGPSPTTTVVLAADASLGQSQLAIHLGGDLIFPINTELSLSLRGGGGFDDGTVLGLGVGLLTGNTSFDLALHSYPSDFTDERLLGFALTVTF
jgi:hypothetical protein